MQWKIIKINENLSRKGYFCGSSRHVHVFHICTPVCVYIITLTLSSLSIYIWVSIFSLFMNRSFINLSLSSSNDLPWCWLFKPRFFYYQQSIVISGIKIHGKDENLTQYSDFYKIKCVDDKSWCDSNSK